MFQATIVNTKSWKNSIEAIVALIDEGTLQLDESGMKLRAMDPSQIALVDFFLPAESFEKYKVDKPVNIGINFLELSKITKRLKSDDQIELSLESRLKMVFKGATTRTFNLAIIESTSTPPKEPNIEFTSEIKLGASVLKEALKDAELVSNHVAMKLDDGFSITADGDTGSVDINFTDENILGMNVDANSRSVFALDQLNNLLRAADQKTIVLLKIKTDAPIRIEYAIGDGRVIYYLAPRIESV